MKNELIRICKRYGVKLKIKKLDDLRACYIHSKNLIIINSDEIQNTSKNELLSILFHELGHKYCNDTSERLVRRTGLRAERFVDRWTSKELKKRDYNFKYSFFYYEDGMNKRLQKYFNELFKKER